MSDAPSALDDALLAARLCAVDPVGLGGLILRGGGDVRDQVVAALRAGLPDGAPLRRVPLHVDDDALLGGLDLGATLALGRPVRQHGVLAAANGGLVLLRRGSRGCSIRALWRARPCGLRWSRSTTGWRTKRYRPSWSSGWRFGSTFLRAGFLRIPLPRRRPGPS
jgi:hypothetical protein